MVDAQWFIGRDGQSFGPFSLAQLISFVSDGTLRQDDLAWRQGLQEWSVASSIPGLWLPPNLSEKSTWPSLAEDDLARAPASDAVAPRSVSADPEQKQTRESNFWVRHWRGELSLVKSYWLVGTLLTIVLIFLAALFGEALGAADLTPTAVGIWLTAFLVAICTFTVWQLVGIWRSAGNHMRITKRRGWALAARVMVVLSAIRAISDFSSQIAPMLSASVQLATGQDDIPPHSVRLMRDGEEIELSGGMPFGTADSLRTFLDAAPTVKVVHLNSVGGLLAEGYKLQKLLRERQLITYTSVDCVSACTIAFLGGSHRYLSEKGRLGFHSANFGGLDQKDLPEVNREMRAVLIAHGAPSHFVERAVATDASSMWYPSHQELVDAKIITAVVDSSNFAMSGVRGWQDNAALEQALSAAPYARALKQNNTPAYQKLAAKFAESMKAGRSELELTAAIHSVFTTEILPGYMRVARDLPLIRYWKSQIAEIRHLADTNANLCLEFLNVIPRRQWDPLRHFPPHLVEEDMASLVHLIETTHTMPAPAPADHELLQEDTLAAFASLESAMPGASAIAIEPQKYTDKPQLVCGSIVAFYDAVLALPPDRAGRFLRSVSAENQ